MLPPAPKYGPELLSNNLDKISCMKMYQMIYDDGRFYLGIEIFDKLSSFLYKRKRNFNVSASADAYKQFGHPVQVIEDYRLAKIYFHNKIYYDK